MDVKSIRFLYVFLVSTKFDWIFQSLHIRWRMFLQKGKGTIITVIMLV